MSSKIKQDKIKKLATRFG